MPVRGPRARKRWPAGSWPVGVDALRPLVPAVRNGQRVAGAVRRAAPGARAGELADGVAPLLVEFRQCIGDGLKRPIHDGLLLGQLSDQAVQALGGRDDISALVVEIRGESVQLLYEAAQILLAAPKRGTERLGDVL